MKQQKLILTLATFVLCACLTHATNYGLWFNTTQFSDNALSFADGQFVYNPATNVLTINSVDSASSYLTIDQDVTLKFIGNSTFNGIYESDPEDVYTITIQTEGAASLTVPFESAFYVNDFIVTFDNCNFTLNNSFTGNISQATLFAGEIILQNCSISTPTNGEISIIDDTDFYTITDSDGNFVRSFTISPTQNTTNAHTIISRIHGDNNNKNVVITHSASQQNLHKAVAIRNNSESVKLANAIAEAERIFSEELTRMDIVLPAPITARVQFGDESQFIESDELCIVETTYKDTTRVYNENYPHIGDNVDFTHCWYPLSLYHLMYQQKISDEPCVTIYLNPDKNYYYGTDTDAIEDDQYDMITVLLRGLVIGCGFQSSFNIASDGTLSLGIDYQGTKSYTVFDAYLTNEYGNIYEYVNNVRNFLNSRVYNGIRQVELHNDFLVCPECNPSLNTLNTISYAAFINDSTIDAELMQPTLYQGEIIRSITPNTEVVLHNIGWQRDLVVGDQQPQCTISGSSTIYPNTNYTYTSNFSNGIINAMDCSLFFGDSTYTISSSTDSYTLQVSFGSLPEKEWERNPVTKNIIGVVTAKAQSFNSTETNKFGALSVEIPYKPNKPLCNIIEVEADTSSFNVNIEALSNGCESYIITCTPTIPGASICDTVTADMLNYTIENLSASQTYGISIAGLNSIGKSTEVHQLVGHTSYPLTLHIEASRNYISYYFTENGGYATELEIASVTIRDMQGFVVQTCSEGQNQNIDISGLNSNTIYILSVALTDGRTFAKQFRKL